MRFFLIIDTPNRLFHLEDISQLHNQSKATKSIDCEEIENPNNYYYSLRKNKINEFAI